MSNLLRCINKIPLQFSDHTDLREHFVDQHFLCEDGDCKENIFSAVFRSDIDLKGESLKLFQTTNVELLYLNWFHSNFTAHKANVHGQTSKQARTIEFQFNLAPRGRSNQDNGAIATNVPEISPITTTTSIQPRKVIDARNEQEFPSLGGGASINIRPTVTLNMRPSTSGLARTKENFPALGGSSTNGREPFKPPNSAPTVNASTLLFRTPAKTTANNNASNKTNAAKKPKPVPIKSNDFPALPGSSTSNRSQRSNFENDMIEMPSIQNASVISAKHRTLVQPVQQRNESANLAAITFGHQKIKTNRSQRANLENDMIETPLVLNASVVSAKHRLLVQPYESANSAANSLGNQKIKTIQRTEVKPQAISNEHVPSMKSKDSFPALGGASSAQASATPQWLNGTNGGSKKSNQISKKLKVAPAPILPTGKSNESSKKDEDASKKAKANDKSKANDKKKDTTKTENSIDKNGSGKKDKTATKKLDESAKKTKENNDKNTERNGNGNKSEKRSGNVGATTNGSSTSNGTINSYSSVAHFTMPPPGFPAKNSETSTKVPPGFESLSNDSKNISYSYMSPSNALQRNKVGYRPKQQLFPIQYRKNDLPLYL